MKTKILSYLIVFIAILNVIGMTDTADASSANPINGFAGGTGTLSDPYIITNQTQLALMSSNLSSSFKLANDITLTGYWTPIGTESKPFKGTIDGNNKTIYNMRVARNSNHNGLIGYGTNITIKDLTLNQGSVISTANYNASFVGHGSVSVVLTNCHSNLSISGATRAGGLVGSCFAANIQNCTFSGKVTGTSHTGGIVGRAYRRWNGNESVIKYCSVFNSDEPNIPIRIKGKSQTGGIAGSITGTIEKCYVGADVEGDYNVGGIAGDLYYANEHATPMTADIRDCFSTGNVTAKASNGIVGGIVGSAAIESTAYAHYISRCYSTGNVHNSSATAQYTGGIVGSAGLYNSNKYSVIQNCFALNNIVSQVKGIASANYIGRIAGRNNYSSRNRAINTLKILQGGLENTEPSDIYACQGTTITEEEARTQKTYQDLGWDFNTVWKMDSSISPYPILQGVDMGIGDYENEPLEFQANGKKIVGTLRIYQGQELTITAKDSTGTKPITNIESGNDDVAESNVEGEIGTIKGLSVGESIITLHSGTESKEVKVIVSANKITFSSDAEIINNTVCISVDETIELEVISTFPADTISSWEYDNPEIITLNKISANVVEIKGETTDPGGTEITFITASGVKGVLTVIVTSEKTVRELAIILKTGTRHVIDGLYNMERIHMNGSAWTWTSSDPGIVSVDGVGSITTHAEGIASIIASNGIISRKISIIVEEGEPSGQEEEGVILFNRTNLIFDENNRLPLTSAQDFTPVLINKGNKPVQYRSSDESIATVDSMTGTITIVGNGSCIITACDENGAELDKLAIIGSLPVTGIQISAPSGTLAVSDTMQLEASLQPISADAEIRWTVVSSGHVASIDDNGILQANEPGTVFVFAVSEGIISNIITVSIEDGGDDNPPEPNLININTATKEELMTLPGIGEARANDIIEYRTNNGYFEKIEDITNVSGIGNGILENIRDFITV